MRKLILMCLCTVFALGVYAQTTGKTTTSTKATKTEMKTQYACPMCGACSDKAGQCAHCKMDMVKSGTYCCKDCHTTSDKAGKCSKCGMEMAKVECKKGAMKKESGEKMEEKK